MIMHMTRYMDLSSRPGSFLDLVLRRVEQERPGHAMGNPPPMAWYTPEVMEFGTKDSMKPWPGIDMSCFW